MQFTFRLLGFRNTPFATGRVVDIKKEILPVASPAVTRQLIRRGMKYYIYVHIYKELTEGDSRPCFLNEVGGSAKGGAQHSPRLCSTEQGKYVSPYLSRSVPDLLYPYMLIFNWELIHTKSLSHPLTID